MNLTKKLILLLLINILLFTMAYYYYSYMVDAYKLYIESVKSSIQIRILGLDEALAVTFGDGNTTFNSIVTSYEKTKSDLSDVQSKIGSGS